MADIGKTLHEARMNAHLEITDVEDATKIRARFLEAIENEEWDALPGPVYVRSFLRTYANYLELDGRAVVDEYKRRYELPSEQDLRAVSHRPRERDRVRRGPRIPAWALIGLVLVGIVVALYFLGRSPTHKPAAPASVNPVTRRLVRTKPRPAPHRTPATVSLQIKPTGPVYICLVDASGKTLIPGRVFAAGQAVPTQRSRRLLLTLGNNSVRLTVNGKAIGVAPSAAAIGLELTPRGATPLPPSRQPRCT
jgi:hypothetical protein